MRTVDEICEKFGFHNMSATRAALTAIQADARNDGIEAAIQVAGQCGFSCLERIGKIRALKSKPPALECEHLVSSPEFDAEGHLARMRCKNIHCNMIRERGWTSDWKKPV